MTRPRRRRNRPLLVALYVNAGLLAAVLVLLLTRGGPGVGSMAMAGPPAQPIAGGGGGMYLMPAQFSASTWGCYVMDVEAQTLCSYQYFPSQNQLRLTAARYLRYDRQLKAYNTWPLPQDVEHLKDLGVAPVRGKDDDGDPPPVAPEGAHEPASRPYSGATTTPADLPAVPGPAAEPGNSGPERLEPLPPP